MYERSAACDHVNNSASNEEFSEYVECESESDSGVARGADEVENVQVAFKGCLLYGQAACSNTANEGEIAVNTLKGHLGYIEKAALPQPKVGVLLEPSAGGDFTSFQCAGGAFVLQVGTGNGVEGSYYEGTGNDGVMAPVTPINTSTSGFEQRFADNGEAAENEPGAFEGEGSTIHRLEATTEIGGTPETVGEWAKAGQSIVNRVTTEGAVEIKG